MVRRRPDTETSQGDEGNEDDEGEGLLSSGTPGTPVSRRLAGLPLLGWLTVGCINNLAYVIFITAAEDLLTGYSGLILIASIAPALFIKATASLFLYRLPYGPRVWTVGILGCLALLLTSAAPSTAVALFGVSLNSVGGGLGECTFLALTSRVKNGGALAAWSMGTGTSGIMGALLWIVMRQLLKLAPRVILLLCAPLPLIIVLAFRGPVLQSLAQRDGRTGGGEHEQDEEEEEVVVEEEGRHANPLLNGREKMEAMRTILLPYALPLFVVYLFEYTINQSLYLPLGLTSTDIDITKACSMYPRLQLMYQIGVLASRSSLFLFQIPYPGLMAVLQAATFVVLLFQVLESFISVLIIVFSFSLWEGLLGGGCYVNAIALVSTAVKREHREFALTAVSIFDTLGILFAGIISFWLEGALLRYLNMEKAKCD